MSWRQRQKALLRTPEANASKQTPAAAALHKPNKKYYSIIAAMDMDDQPLIATRNAFITLKNRKRTQRSYTDEHRSNYHD